MPDNIAGREQYTGRGSETGLSRDGDLGARYHSQWSPLARALSAAGDHWTLLIVLQLSEPGPRRPVQLRRALAGISSGVLDRHLQQLVRQGLLSRTRYKEMPPRVEIELTEAGRELLPIAGALARWGMRRMWSEPRARERVDVEALLRLLPVLLEESEPLPDGTLELAVQSAEGTRADLRFAIERGQLRALAQSGSGPGEGDGETMRAPPAARIAGDAHAWIAALGPERDYARLRFGGREELARRTLAALPS